MVWLRATQRVLRVLPAPEDADCQSDTALGDWFVNRLVVGRRPLLIMVSSKSLLPILTPAREVRSLPDRLPGLVSDHLHRLGISPALIECEVGAMSPIRTAPTRDRSVVGIMVEFGRILTYQLSQHKWDEAELATLALNLAHTPCHASRPSGEAVWPDLVALELLKARWT